MIYKRFKLSRFRGIDSVTVSLTRGDLVLMVGLNESGKTTILRAIEAFDYRNDPDPDDPPSFAASVRKKSALYTHEPAMITADIELDDDLRVSDVVQGIPGLVGTANRFRTFRDFLRQLNDIGSVRVSRLFPFKDGNPGRPHYRLEGNHAFLEDPAAEQVAQRLVKLSPFILYFEDFTDRIPDRIFAMRSNSAFNADWYDIIDGLFFNTSPAYNVDAFRKLHGRSNPRLDDASTVLRRVNETLNQVFTRKWASLSGVKDISSTELIANNFGARSPHFEIKVTDTDQTTYAVEERSKGALWYLSFLMKTEFRRKKMRQDSGKPIFLIDEPASNLHSSAQSNMLDDFRQLVEDTSVIYSTHSQYLVSLENIRNTYVVTRHEGVVVATRWGEYIQENSQDVSHYKPLADILEIVPYSLDVPWSTAVITEGPSDRHILLVLHRLLFGRDPTWVIYPGTNAFNLGTLISLNIGWQTDFRVLLDSDEAGKEAQQKYIAEFGLDDGIVQVLPHDNMNIEKYFDETEKRTLYKLAVGREKKKRVTKNEFQNTMSLLTGGSASEGDIDKALGTETKLKFKELFDRLW